MHFLEFNYCVLRWCTIHVFCVNYAITMPHSESIKKSMLHSFSAHVYLIGWQKLFQAATTTAKNGHNIELFDSE